MKGAGQFLVAAAIAALLGASALSSEPAQAAAKFVLTSPALRNGGYLPKKYAGNDPQNRNCDGKGISIPLAWRNAPDDTKSYALLMTDAVGHEGLGSTHWVAYGIPGARKAIKEGEGNRPSTELIGGKNGAGTTLYRGPCPPYVDAAHPYVIVLIATDIAPGALRPGMDASELRAALRGHTLAATSFVANYRK
jgi:Raf kinase inhibitor-like YbhB/YbcL family protein